MIDQFTGDYHFLSNFYPVLITYEGLIYYSTEAAYQAAKTTNEILRVSFTVMDPNQAKKAGKRLVLRDDWEIVKLQVMRDLLSLKFEDPELRTALIDTYPHELVEGNTWHDCFWGVCNGKGENNLGKLLMELRESINQ